MPEDTCEIKTLFINESGDENGSYHRERWRKREHGTRSVMKILTVLAELTGFRQSLGVPWYEPDQ